MSKNEGHSSLSGFPVSVVGHYQRHINQMVKAKRRSQRVRISTKEDVGDISPSTGSFFALK